ncbi:hypothetical protein EYC84_005980 [Monilinia fructicola]|uniref:Uncharacterized protein n=1 Tax=Monilinia fructicola TaxID=38448 RepID=A0A5M9K308_MONFR|nr:hypothetical protein EYC84_005980 [Monilinia fructicola]
MGSRWEKISSLSSFGRVGSVGFSCCCSCPSSVSVSASASLTSSSFSSVAWERDCDAWRRWEGMGMGTILSLRVISGLGTMDSLRVISGVTSNVQWVSSLTSTSASSESEEMAEVFSVSVLDSDSHSVPCVKLGTPDQVRMKEEEVVVKVVEVMRSRSIDSRPRLEEAGSELGVEVDEEVWGDMVNFSTGWVFQKMG